MQRYFIPKEQFQETIVQIIDGDAHHLVNVMRARIGQRVICSDGQQREALVEITSLEKNKVEANIVEQLSMTNEPAVVVWIAQSLPKGDKLETVIQKCTEIGAARFIPFLSERTVVQYDEKKEVKLHERWCRIAKEAAEQAHRNRVPIMEPILSWKALVKQIADADLTLICYEKESGLQLRQLLSEGVSPSSAPDHSSPAHHRKILVLVGPEGGFSEKEVSEVIAAGGHSISLGRRILRTETAAMVALTCILYETGEMGA